MKTVSTVSSTVANPFAAIVKHAVISLVAAGIIVIIYLIRYMYNLEFVPGFLLIGAGLSFFGWGGERLWQASIAKMLGKPSIFISIVTLLPFWMMFGGMGFTLGVLLTIKYASFDLQDKPVEILFYAGALAGAAFQTCLFLFSHKVWKPQSAETLSRL